MCCEHIKNTENNEFIVYDYYRYMFFLETVLTKSNSYLIVLNIAPNLRLLVSPA